MDDPVSSRQIDWSAGDKYEAYVGRWSKLVAREFLKWLDLPPSAAWLDVGCGSGALSQTILDQCAPARVTGIDRSEGFVAFARQTISDKRALFQTGDAQAIPMNDAVCDAAVSGLVLNFVPQPIQMVREMARTTRPGGAVALYVWDYAGRMQLMRHFWNAAVILDPRAGDLDEGRRTPICNPEALQDLFRQAGLGEVRTRPIDILTEFTDFDDFWLPFLGGQGPAPGYVMSLSEENRAELRERIRAALPTALDGSIPLMARAWAVRSIR